MHYHYFTIEQRESLEREIRARAAEPTLKDALERLRSPEYGVCTSCGGDIAYARLAEEPTTLLCRDCAELGSDG